jgi:hypothetical protein
MGFDHRTIQPVASLYTDYAIPAHLKQTVYININMTYTHK